jgi:NAD(P)-dependent dehydrogenase (short-subunit alcohol dehydrogenase family)
MPENLFNLDGRVALVTGAGSGIGRHAAALLARHGAKVVLCGRRENALRETAAAIVAAGGAAVIAPMDLADFASIASAIETGQAALGPIDILINNAGIAGHSSVLEMTEAEWDAILDTNLKGAWHCAREVARRLIAAGRPGAIVNIASVLGFVTQKGTGAYAASKSGLIHLTRSMATEWARYGIRANALAPGYIMTDMAADYIDSDRGRKLIDAIPQRRVGTVDDLSGALLFMASGASSYMTGSVVVVDGGTALGAL